MNYLIDTHVLLWSIVDTAKLSPLVKDILQDERNTICVSAISFWEISLKYSIGKLSLDGLTPEQLPDLAMETGFKLIPLSPAESSSYHLLTPAYHKDPFDRMLIRQAIIQNMTLISKDENMIHYKSLGLKLVW